MGRTNCWVYTGCGREPGGANAGDGACPAASDSRLDGVNHGTNGGRACWAVAGTFCDNEVQGTYAAKLATCFECPFYNLVLTEEGRSVTSTNDLVLRLVRMGGTPAV
jgi:hypothetical protein